LIDPALPEITTASPLHSAATRMHTVFFKLTTRMSVLQAWFTAWPIGDL
jgi:hypothetical protein